MTLTFLMNVKLQWNLTLSLEASGVNWRVKFQMLQQRWNLAGAHYHLEVEFFQEKV